jgi:IS30 family transposase
MPHSEHDHWTISLVQSGHLRSAFCGQPTSALTYVRTHLAEGCSPAQIAGWLRRAYPDDMGKQLSTETIYAGLHVLPRGTLRSELLAALR